MSQLRAALADALGPLCRIEREVRPVGDQRLFVVTQLAGGPDLLVKILPAAVSLGMDERHFERELLLLADRLRHNHLVAPKGGGRAGAHIYHTRQFVEGTTLRAWLDRHGSLTLARAVATLRGILAGLAHAHAAGIAHGSVRAENVLLGEDSVVLADTGIAALIGHAALRRSDMVALGAVVREMLTGSPTENPESSRSLPEWLAQWVGTDWRDAGEALSALTASSY